MSVIFRENKTETNLTANAVNQYLLPIDGTAIGCSWANGGNVITIGALTNDVNIGDIVYSATAGIPTWTTVINVNKTAVISQVTVQCLGNETTPLTAASSSASVTFYRPFNVKDFVSAMMNIFGTWSGVLTVYGTSDLINFSLVGTISANGFAIIPLGFKYLAILATTYNSGPVNATISFDLTGGGSVQLVYNGIPVTSATPLPVSATGVAAANATVNAANTARSTSTLVLATQEVDPNGNVLSLKTNGTQILVPTIDTFHLKVHDGWAFIYSNVYNISSVVQNGIIATLAITTGAKYTHLKPRVYFSDAVISSVGASILGSLYEAPSSITLGSAGVTPVNMNRGSANASVDTFYPSASALTGGTLLDSLYIAPGSSTSLGVSYDDNYELVLKPSTTYVIQYSNPNAGTMTGGLGLRATWYED